MCLCMKYVRACVRVCVLWMFGDMSTSVRVGSQDTWTWSFSCQMVHIPKLTFQGNTWWAEGMGGPEEPWGWWGPGSLELIRATSAEGMCSPMHWPPKNEAEVLWGEGGPAWAVWPQRVTALSPSLSRLICKWSSFALGLLASWTHGENRGRQWQSVYGSHSNSVLKAVWCMRVVVHYLTRANASVFPVQLWTWSREPPWLFGEQIICV